MKTGKTGKTEREIEIEIEVIKVRREEEIAAATEEIAAKYDQEIAELRRLIADRARSFGETFKETIERTLGSTDTPCPACGCKPCSGFQRVTTIYY